MVDQIDKSHIMSQPQVILDLDLYKVKVEDLDFKSAFRLTVSKDNYDLYGFVSWFDVHFSHGKKHKVLSTSPLRDETHWKQTVFYL
jgi:protein arginine N-methyltransferase 1